METCGISCILMVLYYYHRVAYPTEKQERKLYRLYGCRCFKGTLASAIADCLSRNRLDVGLFHSSPDFLDNRDGYFPEPLFGQMQEEYTRTVERIRDRVQVETGFPVTADWYRQQLDEKKLLIVQCIVPGDADGIHQETLHWVLVYGYEGEEFLLCNPLSHKIRLTEQELMGYADTPIGFITVTVKDEEDGHER